MSTQRYLVGDLTRKGSRNRNSSAGWNFSIHLSIGADFRSTFNALTVPEYIEAWLIPPACRSVTVAQNGPRYQLQFQSSLMPLIAVRGAWLSRRPERLTLTWNRNDELMRVETILYGELRESAGRTVLHLHQCGFTTAEQSLWHGKLWSSSVERLARLLEFAGGGSHKRVSAISSLHRNAASVNRETGHPAARGKPEAL